jgi:hypothetical protein
MDWQTYLELKKSDPKYQEYRAQKLRGNLAKAPQETRAFLAQMLQDLLEMDQDTTSATDTDAAPSADDPVPDPVDAASEQVD